MGFGLWAALHRRVAQGVDLLRELEGKKIAVDVSIWVVEADVLRAKVPWLTPETAALRLCFQRLVLWLRYGLTPVIVLEGSAGSRGMRAGRRAAGLGTSFAKTLRDIQNLCEALGVPCVCAPGEGEAWCVRLAQLGLVDAIATNDCDVFVWGAQCPVLKDLRIELPISSSRAEIVDNMAARLFLTREALVLIAALMGNEYDGDGGCGVARVGLQTAVHGIQWFQSYHNDHGSQDSCLITAFCKELSAMSDGQGDGVLPLLTRLRNLTRCTGCARCGHGSVRKAMHGTRGCSSCGTSSGCTPRLAADGSDRIQLCECAYCSAVREVSRGSEEIHAKARACALIFERAGLDNGFRQRLEATASNYTLPTLLESERASLGNISWKGPAICDAVVRALDGTVEVHSIHESVLQLRLWWCLSVAAQEAPVALQDSQQSPTALAAWAQGRGLDFVPHRRRKSFTDSDLTVLLDWQSLVGASASDATATQNLPARKRHGRTSLVKLLGRFVGIPRAEAKLEAKQLRGADTKGTRQLHLKDFFHKAIQTPESMEVPMPSPCTPTRVRRRSASPDSSRKRLRSREHTGDDGFATAQSQTSELSKTPESSQALELTQASAVDGGTVSAAQTPESSAGAAAMVMEVPAPLPRTPTRVPRRNATPDSLRKRLRPREHPGAVSAAETPESSAGAAAMVTEVPAPPPCTPTRVRRRKASPGSSRKQLRSQAHAGDDGVATTQVSHSPQVLKLEFKGSAAEAAEVPSRRKALLNPGVPIEIVNASDSEECLPQSCW